MIGTSLSGGAVLRCVLADLAASLRAEARRVDERRLVVLAGTHSTCVEAIDELLDGGEVDPSTVTYVGRAAVDHRTVRPDRAASLLGTTRDCLIYDAHEALDPTAIGRVVGTVSGGGLLVFLTPPLDAWPAQRDAFDRTLAVPPFDLSDVSGRFKQWFVDTLRTHPGIAIVDVDSRTVERDGLTDPPARAATPSPTIPDRYQFPLEAYEACLTADQVAALHAFESVTNPGRAVVVEADRGRGKSSVAGLAAAAFAFEGDQVVITAPSFRSAAAAFDRAGELLDRLDVRQPTDDDRRLASAVGGRITYCPPAAAADTAADVHIVDEAAAIAVPVLTAFLDKRRVAFTTTIHGYEGAGRGFSIRFRDRLDASDLVVTDCPMAEPIRYAPGDPIEVWSFRALLLDAAPAADQLVLDATPESVEYRGLSPDRLLADEPLFRQAVGLLVLAHYRTEPADVARLLDAPNVSIRALLADGHVASIALLAREGGLSATRRADMYEGGRIRGHMLPDVLTSQLRDEAAGRPWGYRIMRIATHAAVRSRGLGSTLVEAVHREVAETADWLGVGYGATPRLVDFWDRNGFSTVHLSTTQNESSGEHSAIMLRPISAAGAALHDRHTAWFARRVPGVLADALDDLDPDIARATCRATETTVDLDLGADDWRRVAGVAYGPGLIDVDPAPFRTIARKHLIDPEDPKLLTADQERLLVRKVLQATPWPAIVEDLGYPSRRQCMRALGDAYQPLVDEYGTDAARAERERYGGSR